MGRFHVPSTEDGNELPFLLKAIYFKQISQQYRKIMGEEFNDG
jgi:hypothetical protein